MYRGLFIFSVFQMDHTLSRLFIFKWQQFILNYLWTKHSECLSEETFPRAERVETSLLSTWVDNLIGYVAFKFWAPERLWMRDFFTYPHAMSLTFSKVMYITCLCKLSSNTSNAFPDLAFLLQLPWIIMGLNSKGQNNQFLCKMIR